MSKRKSGSFRQQPIPTAPVQSQGPFDGPEFNWEELESIYAHQAALCMIPAQLSQLLSDPTAVAALENQAAVTERAKIFANDLQTYARRLMNIHSRHAGRRGPCLTADANLQAIQIMEAYVQWEDSYNSVIMPNLSFIQQAFATIGTPSGTN